MNRRDFLKSALVVPIVVALRRWWKGPRWLQGRIEDVRRYNRALSPEEIRSIWIRSIWKEWCEGKPLSETEFRILQSTPWDMLPWDMFSCPFTGGLVGAWFLRDGVIVEERRIDE